MSQPILKDMLVLELASVLAGPSVGQFFAELGATVIKIENAATNGDVTRTWKLTAEDPTTNTPAYFCAANWGKQSLTLDLTRQTDLERLYTLVPKADIVLTSYKPGDAEKLQVDYTTLQGINPKLIYGHITGYGPEDERAGYDAVVQAEAGFMYLNGEANGDPTKMPVALMDILTAHQLKEGLLLALFQRERTGQGQLVEVSLVHSAISALANQATNYLVAGHNPTRMGSEHPNIVPYGSLFTSRDNKQLVLAIGNDRQFAKLCALLGQPEFARHPKYNTNYNRVQNRKEVNSMLQASIAMQDRDTLLEKLHQQHVPAGAVNTIADVFDLPQARQMLLTYPGAKPGVKQVAFTMAGHGQARITPPPVYKQKV
ncbi:CaiB/BaiF CoA transferase family protein [Pontibacter arcticus]|uniref:CoA transferase n=1 Tax=Pontibacter arcticus TaxID=2080288 RepID=A0A364RBD9_9BACT|nr:CaiB/BaiF CoA-transferase family protein [Pontibacter arcticus]RAU81609.1 CoA transferase [Pontibacter arcticus]